MPIIEGGHSDTLMQDVWRFRGGPPGEALYKTVYRAKSASSSVNYQRPVSEAGLQVAEIWVHNPRMMYPKPPSDGRALAPTRPQWPKPFLRENLLWNRQVWEDEHRVARYNESWPRIYHYRWWGSNPDETFDMTIGDTPIDTSPEQETFMVRLDSCLPCVTLTSPAGRATQDRLCLERQNSQSQLLGAGGCQSRILISGLLGAR